MSFIRPGRSVPVEFTPSEGDAPTSDSALPSGALSFNVDWDAVTGADSYVIYVSDSTVTTPDASLYSYWYLDTAPPKTIGSVQSGTKYVRIAAVEGGWLGDLSHEMTFAPA